MRIIFLQLPRLDNAARGRTENVPLAGVYLQHALQRAGLSAQAQFVTGEGSDAALLDFLAAQRPDAIAATLYLWNVERTLQVLRRARALLPGVKIFGGGPEVAQEHPFLFRSRVFDALVEGEGEAVFPELLRGRMNFRNVARRLGNRYAWGAQPAPASKLAEMLPPADDARLQPDAHGMAYLETGRGCPLHCAYCRYPSLRTRMSFLSATEALARVRVLRQRGAKEIRFIDPTLNANPQFEALLRGLVRLNRSGQLKFFGELQAERLSADQMALLPRAGYTEIEAGVQSRDPLVLRAVHRPERLAPLERNIAALAQAGVRVTIDLMYGLPGQRASEVRSSLRWAWRQPRAYVQCLQTLLLPGTELRARRRELGLHADAHPPYGVCATPAMSAADIHALEATIYRKEAPDCPTRRFVGKNLPDLFRERNVVEVPHGELALPRSARSALIFRGDDLWAARAQLVRLVRQALRAEPHALWQFVLEPRAEEPLDLLDALLAEIRRHPARWQDRLATVAATGKLASRRVFIRLRRHGRFSRQWMIAAENVLAKAFY